MPLDKPPFDKPEFAARLRSLRAEKKLTQEQVADFVGCHQTSVSAWEKDEKSPTPSAPEIAALCALFEVSSDYIIGLSPHRQALPPGRVLVDLDIYEKGPPGADWAIDIPERAKIVTSTEWKAMQERAAGRMRGGRIE